MGNLSSVSECLEIPDYIIKIKTGDTKGAGLHNRAHIILINEDGKQSRKIQLNGCSLTVFKKGRTDKFKVTKLPKFGHIDRIIIEKHKDQNDVDWFVDYIIVKHICDNIESESVFPTYRWLRGDKPMEICEFDSSLPQLSITPEQRKNELEFKRLAYLYKRDEDELPTRMVKIPHDEIFSNFYKWDVLQKKADLHRLYETSQYGNEENWRSFEEIENLFQDKGKFRRPKVLNDDWTSDEHFGSQRIKGCNSQSLKLCTKIPDNFAVSDELVAEQLDSLTLAEAIELKRLFIVNHSILDGIYDSSCNQNIPSPMALFYLNKQKQLIPIAIQLHQRRGERNPVFVPGDPHYTWLLAKIWFNYADATFHRACLLFTCSQWLLEIICISVHRHLSPSHPIFKVLAPYLRLVLAINHFEMRPLLKEDNWLDANVPIKREGYYEIIKKYWKEYNFSSSNIYRAMEKNGVLGTDVLREYPYRDDCLLLHNCIESYITSVVEGNYEDQNELLMDEELQSWAAEMTCQDTCDIKGLPGNGEIKSNETLIEIITEIVFKATVEHAAFSLPLYDEAAFVPNYPLAMRGIPPMSKDSLCEADLMEHLPTKQVTLELIIVNKVISERGTSGMADSRALYSFDPILHPGRERFLGALREAAAKITVRNRKRKRRYDYLNPASSRTQFLHS